MNTELTTFAALLKANGFTVFLYKYKENNYFSYSKGGNFGYVQPERLGGGFSFSRKHIANATTGTGFGIDTDGKLTIENAIKSFSFPEWVNGTQRAASKPYDNIEHFLKLNKDCFISEKRIFHFNTGVKLPNSVPGATISPNGVSLIPFECEDVPPNASFMFACDNPALATEGQKAFEIHNSNLVSKYAYFQIN